MKKESREVERKGRERTGENKRGKVRGGSCHCTWKRTEQKVQEEKIRGSRNPAWGRVGEGGSVGITAVGEAARERREYRFIST